MTTIAGGMDGPIEGPEGRPGPALRARARAWPVHVGLDQLPLDRLPLDDGADFDMSDGAAPRSPWRGGLAAAGRHSAFVGFLRIAILAGCGAAIALVLAVGFFDPFGILPRAISIGQVGLDGTKVTLDAPKISGFQKDQRPYVIKARKGIQDLTTPNIVELLDIDAEIGTEDAETIRVMAARAVYNSQVDNILLQGDVHIAHTGGYDAAMQTASIDFKTGSLVSDAPVRVRLDGGSIAADRMTLTDHGHKVSFEGGVRSVIDETADLDRQNDQEQELEQELEQAKDARPMDPAK